MIKTSVRLDRREHLERVLVYTSLAIPLLLSLKVFPWEQGLLISALIALAVLLELRGRYLPRLLVNLLGLTIIAYFVVTVTLTTLPESVLRTLFLLLSLKLFEKKRLRDYFQIYLLELLSFAGLSFYYIGLWFFLLLLLQLFMICLFLFLHLYFEEGEVSLLSRNEFRAIILTVFALFFATILVGSLFFFALPRLENPLFGLGQGERGRGKTGFTEEIRLGGVSQIQESTKVVIRFTLEGETLRDPSNLYIRLLTYDHFDGRAWKRMAGEVALPQRGVQGHTKRALLYLLEEMEGYIPTIEYTYYLKGNFKFLHFRDGTIKTADQITYPLRIELQFSEEQIGSPQNGEDLSNYLQVPQGMGDAIRSLATSLKGETPAETIRNTLNFLKQSDFKHSLTDLPRGDRPLEEFLITRKKGNCEFFAGAMAILLRLNGIPARVVGGFKGAVYHPQGNYYLVLEKFAHAWVEAYLEGRWQRFDPTPVATFGVFQRERNVFLKIKIYLDLLNFYYMKFIVDYDLQKQKRLLQTLGNLFHRAKSIPEDRQLTARAKDLKKSALPLFIFALILVLSLLLLRYREKLILLKDYLTRRERRLLLAFERELEKWGYLREPWEGIFEFAERIGDERVRKIALEFAEIYGSYLYRDRSVDREGLERLRKCLKALKSLRLEKGK